jgi:hypothetical protein
MKTTYYIQRAAILMILIILSTGCETVVTNDITLNGSVPRLVIDGGIERNIRTPLTEQTIKLSTTIGFLDQEDPTEVLDATVVVNDGNQDFVFVHQGNGIYSNATIQATLNTEYTLTINWNGEIYVGSDTLFEVPFFQDVYVDFEEETLFTDEGYFVKFDSEDPQEEDNFYYYRVFRNGEFFIVADPGNSSTLVESDEFFNGQLRTGVKPNEEVIFEVGDVATIQQLGITEEYHDFLTELFVQTGNQGLSFVGNPPPASIRGNIINTITPANRALGFFYCSDVEEATITVTD